MARQSGEQRRLVPCGLKLSVPDSIAWVEMPPFKLQTRAENALVRATRQMFIDPQLFKGRCRSSKLALDQVRRRKIVRWAREVCTIIRVTLAIYQVEWKSREKIKSANQFRRGKQDRDYVCPGRNSESNRAMSTSSCINANCNGVLPSLSSTSKSVLCSNSMRATSRSGPS